MICELQLHRLQWHYTSLYRPFRWWRRPSEQAPHPSADRGCLLWLSFEPLVDLYGRQLGSVGHDRSLVVDFMVHVRWGDEGWKRRWTWLLGVLGHGRYRGQITGQRQEQIRGQIWGQLWGRTDSRTGVTSFLPEGKSTQSRHFLSFRGKFTLLERVSMCAKKKPLPQCSHFQV